MNGCLVVVVLGTRRIAEEDMNAVVGEQDEKKKK